MWKTLICSLIIMPSFAFGTWNTKAREAVSQIIRESKAGDEKFGIWVHRGDQVVEHNGTRQFVPASLSKIPTALTFFNEKSMDDRFHTWVYKTGKVENGVLKGDLYLKGGGDPSFVSESMWMLVKELKRTDIREVTGKLYLDESFFDDDYYSSGRQTRRVDRAYDAPVSALSFNWNTISIYVRPGKKSGEPARVYTDPSLDFIKIKNRAKTTSSRKTSLNVSRTLKGQDIVISVGGKISLQKDEKAFYKSIGDAALWTGYNFKDQLNKAGIKLVGDVEKKIVPENADLLVEYDSWSMARILAAMDKFSNNFVAEMITKHLGKQSRVPAKIGDGISKITDFLNKSGWQENEYRFVNPSGFTRENKMRPDKLGTLLVASAQDFKLAPEFMASLPISGTDGTLKDRMKQTMREKVRAKTGYLSGVVGLAGYMEPKTGKEPITFVFFYNGPYKHDWEVRALFDKLLWKLYQAS